jgi:uncharacterized secreted protein with C-terminal beta-propeller domain
MIRSLPLWTMVLACNVDDPVPVVDANGALRRLSSCEEVRAALEDAVVEQTVEGRYGSWGWAVEDGADGGPPTPAPTDYTTTNVQEAGVDEPDLVKTNGTHMFIAQDRALHVLRSWPAADTAELASVTLPGWATGLFLLDDRVVVLAQVDAGTDPTLPAFTDGWAVTRVLVYDVSDPANPALLRTQDFEGYLADARMIGDQAWLVINQWLAVPQPVWDAAWTSIEASPYLSWDSPQETRDAMKALARAAVQPAVHAAMATVDIPSLLPAWQQDGAGAAPLLACGELYATATPSHLSMMSVIQFDVTDLGVAATGLMSDGWTVYASLQNLYVAQTSWWWWGAEDAGVTQIHQFALEADGPRYAASGEVDGWIYDAFGMSEHAGFLRVATTDFGGWWWGPVDPAAEPAANHITVLHDDGAGALGVVGHVGGIAPGEQIQAARFLGDKGYIVTFRRTDPLFTLDLSDPTNPTVVGELVLPGYSAYLHPMDDDHLLAVGMQGLETGELTGLAVSIFDVSDLANPTLQDQYDLTEQGWAWSEAMWDHHAFTWHRDVLTIPAYFERYDAGTGTWTGFSGAISLRASVTDGLAELGRVDHHDLVDASTCLYARWWDYGEDACAWGGEWWYAQVRRSVYIEDNLYTISNYGVKVNALNDPSVRIATVVFYPTGG